MNIESPTIEKAAAKDSHYLGDIEELIAYYDSRMSEKGRERMKRLVENIGQEIQQLPETYREQLEKEVTDEIRKPLSAAS